VETGPPCESPRGGKKQQQQRAPARAEARKLAQSSQPPAIVLAFAGYDAARSLLLCSFRFYGAFDSDLPCLAGSLCSPRQRQRCASTSATQQVKQIKLICVLRRIGESKAARSEFINLCGCVRNCHARRQVFCLLFILMARTGRAATRVMNIHRQASHFRFQSWCTLSAGMNRESDSSHELKVSSSFAVIATDSSSHRAGKVGIEQTLPSPALRSHHVRSYAATSAELCALRK
jgi:hypothetical protein